MIMTADIFPLGNLRDSNEPERHERADAAANRARIVEVAERLFAEKGVAAVHMADIAAEAGVGKGTLYRRFANKGELCLALMDTQMRQFQDTMLDRMREMSAHDVSALSQLESFLGALVYFTDRHLPLLCEVQQQSEMLDRSDLVRPHFWQYMTVHGLLQTAVERGELPRGIDTAYLAEALLAPLTVSVFRFQLETLGFSLERVSAGFSTLVESLRHLNSAP